MIRYPQAIPGKFGEKCPYCGRKKNISARFCRKCDPAFRSFSRSVEWAEENAAGPCTLVFRQYGYTYVQWPSRVMEGAAA